MSGRQPREPWWTLPAILFAGSGFAFQIAVLALALALALAIAKWVLV